LREKHVIACAVWETDILPEVYIDALQLVNEVWTCSEFTHSVFARHFDNVYKIPYVVSAPEVTAADALATQDMLRYDPEVYYFYTIADSVNPRKNLSATVEAFLQPRPAACRKAVLVIKQYRKALPHLSSLPNVISISEMVPDGVMGALHRTCDCYVSSHCAEAWGLSISDAMAFGNAAIATGYSGNTEYMSDRNAFPVKFELTNIREEDLRFQPRLLSAHMHWAYIDVNDLASKMVHCLENPDIGSRRHQATQLVHEYSHERVGIDRREAGRYLMRQGFRSNSSSSCLSIHMIKYRRRQCSDSTDRHSDSTVTASPAALSTSTTSRALTISLIPVSSG
jgi:glycosyltransferase involved in cell wall biosynthesis